MRPDAILAVVWLGLLGSGAAYLVFFRLLGRWGATRTSLVAYLLPVFGIVLGAIVLSEPIDAAAAGRHGARHRRHRPRERTLGSTPALRPDRERPPHRTAPRVLARSSVIRCATVPDA